MIPICPLNLFPKYSTVNPMSISPTAGRWDDICTNIDVLYIALKWVTWQQFIVEATSYFYCISL